MNQAASRSRSKAALQRATHAGVESLERRFFLSATIDINAIRAVALGLPPVTPGAEAAEVGPRLLPAPRAQELPELGFSPLTPFASLGSYAYSYVSSLTQPNDPYYVTFNADSLFGNGQRATIVITPVPGPGDNLRPRVSLFDSADNILAAAGAVTTGGTVSIQARVSGGPYRVRVIGDAGTTGQFTITVYLGAAPEPEMYGGAGNATQATALDLDTAFSFVDGSGTRAVANASGKLPVWTGGDDDWFRFSLSAGTSASVGLEAFSQSGTNPVAPHLELYNASGVRVAAGVIGVNNQLAFFTGIPDFALGAGIYYARVFGGANYDYTLTVARGVSLDLESSDLFQTQAIHSLAAGATQTVLGDMGSTVDSDVYRVTVPGGTNLVLNTTTPGDGAGAPANTLDPRLRLLSESRVQLAADDDSAPDGHNASLSYTTPAGSAATYLVEVTGEAPPQRDATTGAYLLTLTGQDAAPAPFTMLPVFGTGSVISAPPNFVSVLFSDFVNLATVQPSDLKMDGVSATAVDVSDGKGVTFSFANVGAGSHTLTLAAGAVTDLRSTPVAALNETFVVDNSPPRVIATTVSRGDIRTTGDQRFQFTFSRPMDHSFLMQPTVFSIVGRYTGTQVFTTSYFYDESSTVFTIDCTVPVEDEYTLTLHSGAQMFSDTVGHALDGEANTWPLPPQGSGDGVAGGDFAVTFQVDAAGPTLLTGLTAQSPVGSMIYQGALSTLVINNPTDSDVTSLNLDGKQTLTLSVDPGTPALAPTAVLRDPNGAIVASANAAAGQSARIQTAVIPVAGAYTLTVNGGAGGTQGKYTVNATLNAAQEIEDVGGPTDNTTATAQSLDGAFIALPGALASARRAAVLGRAGPLPLQNLIIEDFEGGPLGPAWTTYSSLSGGRVVVSSAQGAATGTSALLMDTSTTDLTLNEAIWTVDLSNVVGATLSFSQRSFNDAIDTLPVSYAGHANGDGVSISVDGTDWYRISTPFGSSTWPSITIDLAAAAQSAGITLGANTRIKFQQYGNAPISTAASADGRGFDNIIIQGGIPAEDFYSFTLAQGEAMSLAVARQGATGANPGVSLFDAAGNVLAAGVGGTSNFNSGVSDFVAPAAGTYYAGVRSSGSSAPYRLVVTAGATFEREPTSSIPASQTIGRSGVVLGQRDTAGGDDGFLFAATAGDTVTISTATPGDGAGDFVNTFNPKLSVSGPIGTQGASDDNSAADGRNALLTYTVPVDGWYAVNVGGSTVNGGTVTGEYVLSVTGATPPADLPGKPDLIDASDTGFLATDNATNLNNATPAQTLTFSVPDTVPGATVTLYSGSTLIGSALATGSTTLVTTNGSTKISDGPWSITARQTLPGQPQSALSPPLGISIDTFPPTRPSPPTMTAASDTGIATDRVTSMLTPTFNISGGVSPRVYLDGVRVTIGYPPAPFSTYTLAAMTPGTHTIAVASADLVGNESISDPVTFVLDPTPPTKPTLDAPTLTVVPSAAYTFRVIYSDNYAIDTASFDGSDIRVTGPNGFNRAATFVSVDNTTPGATRTATYAVTPADNSWDLVDRGTYTVALQGSQVKDLAGAFLAATTLGTFLVFDGPPAAPDLVDASDTGVDPADNLTSRSNASAATTLQFDVPNTFGGNLVTVYADGAAIGSATATADSTTTRVTTNGTLALSDGPHVFTARQTPAGKPQSADSPPITVTVDAVAPTASVIHDRAHPAGTVRVTFSEALAAPPAGGSLSVLRLATAAGQPDEPVTTTLQSWDAATRTATFTLSSSPTALPPDGNYWATFSTVGIADAAGNAMAQPGVSAEFFVFAGDADGDRTVGPGDFNLLATHFGLSGQTWSTGDFDGDGVVGPGDFNLLASRFGTTLASPPAGGAASSLFSSKGPIRELLGSA